MTEIPAPSLEGNLLDEPARQFLAVSLPPSYFTSDRSYPVVYFLPGYGEDERSIAYGRHGIVLPRTVDAVMQAGLVHEMILVVVSGRNSMGGSFYVNSPVTGHWEDYVIRDVVEYVDRSYRTLDQPSSRGLAGHSMGGFAALNLAMRHPEIFGAVYAMSPGLFAPGGLEASPILHAADDNQALVQMVQTLGGMDRESAEHEFEALLSGLTAERRFTLAYGMAFAPNADAGPPYIDLPLRPSEAGFLRTAAWWRWEAGFGDLPAKVSAHREGLLSLRAIGVEVGLSEEMTWIPAGCAYFSDLLTASRIPHRFVTFDGGHADRLAERFHDAMLPFFSRALAVGPQASSDS